MIKYFLPKGEFSKNLITLITGTTIAQVIPVLFIPLLTRIYTPGDFGLFALYFNIVIFLSVLATARYELAVVLPKEDKDAISIIGGGMIISLAFSLLVLGVVFLFNGTITAWLNNDRISGYLFLVPAAVLFIAIFKLLNAWLLRRKAFRSLSVNKIAHKLSESVCNVSFYLLPFNGLVLGNLAGRLILVAVASYQSLKNAFSFSTLNIRTIRKNLKIYHDFPVYNLLPAFLNSFSAMIPIFVVSSLYDEATTGYVNLSQQLLAFPLVMISANISEVLFQRIAEKKNKGMPVASDIRSLTLRLFAIAVAFTLVLLLFAPLLFSVVFGDEWETSGHYTRILVIAYAVKFTVSPLSMVFPALGQVKIGSVWQIFYFCCMSSLFFIKGLSVTQLLMLCAGIEVVAYLVHWLLIVRVVGKFDKSLAI